ncbi:PAS domain S-box protein [Tistrella mobilis]|uniref:CHASE domain-containing hybrid sensor histidine kinase/response regulator n=1 Tax=Tistrella mobilis TaxID=171437 RepID=UPI0031F64303
MLRPAYVRIVPALVLLAGLLTAGNAWYLQRDENRAETNRQLNRAAAEAAQTIEDRLQIVEHTLHGARGAMVAVGSRSFDEESFRRFAEAIDFRDELPGALALGFVRRVDAADLAAYQARERREGREDFRVQPIAPGRAGEHLIVEYAHPAGAEGLATGLDLVTNPAIREAAALALTTDTAILSAPLILRPSGPASEMTGMVMALPVRSAMHGPADALVIMSLAVDRVLSLGLSRDDTLMVTISDVTDHPGGAILQLTGSADLKGQRVYRPVTFYGRHWRVDVTPGPAFIARLNLLSPWWVAASHLGLAVIAALLAYLILNRVDRRLRDDARRLAAADELERLVAIRTAELREREARFRAITELSADWYWQTDADGRFTEISGGIERLGFDADHAIGRSRRELAADPDDPGLAIYDAVAARRQPFRRVAYRVAGGEGEMRTIEISGDPIFGSDGRFLGYRGSGRDVTDDVTARREIEQAYATVAGVLDASMNAVFVHVAERDEAGRLTDLRLSMINAAGEALLGVRAEEVIGSSLRGSLLPGEEEVFHRARSVVGTGRPERFYQLVHRAGRDVWVMIQAVRLGDGCVITAADVTEARIREARLRESEARLQALIGTVGVGIVVLDGEGQVTMMNAAGERLFDRRAAEVVGENFCHLVPRPEGLEAADGECGGSIADGCGAIHQAIALRADGTEVPVEVSIGAFDTGDGPMYVAAIADMTERNRSMTELRRAREEADAANAAKSAFLANMSHEIRTPMNGVTGMLQILLGTPLDADQRRYAEVARDSADSLLGLIDDILDVSKLEAGRMELEHLPFDLEDLVDGVIAILAPRARDRRIDLAGVVDPSAAGSWIGDPTRIRQILVNLAGNAVKFTTAGHVSIDVSAVAHREVDPDGRGRLRFRVEDTGVGIAADHLDQLFRPFSQADASVTRRFGGTGLGLAICRDLTALMGGTIDVVSREGEGSVFTVEIGLERVPDAARMAPALPVLAGRRALVVDAVEVTRRMIARQIEALGMDCVEVASAGEALIILEMSVAGERPIDLVVSGLNLTGLSAARLARWVRLDPDLAGVRVIAATCGAPVPDEELYDGVVSKPVRRRELAELMHRLLDPEAAAAHRGNPVPAEGPGHGRRLLLVEDNATNRTVATVMLERQGYTVETAETGEGVELRLADGNFDAVLMDIQMPVVDGIEATRRIRAAEAAACLPPVPIVALTANAMAGMREEYLAAGMNDYLAKPFQVDDLLAVVAKWCGGRPAADAAPSGPTPSRPTPAPAAPAPATPAPAVPVLDETALDQVAAVLPVEKFEDLVQSFVTAGVAQLDEVRAARAARDIDRLRRSGHDIISTAGNCGLMQLSDAGRRLQVAARAGDLDQAVEVAGEILDVGPAAIEAIRTRFGSPRSAA